MTCLNLSRCSKVSHCCVYPEVLACSLWCLTVALWVCCHVPRGPVPTQRTTTLWHCRVSHGCKCVESYTVRLAQLLALIKLWRFSRSMAMLSQMHSLNWLRSYRRQVTRLTLSRCSEVSHSCVYPEVLACSVWSNCCILGVPSCAKGPCARPADYNTVAL